MEEQYNLGDDLPLPPARLFERLALLPGYIWDRGIEPVHSTYDNWHIAGIRQALDNDVVTPAANSSGTPNSARDSPRLDMRPPFRHWRSSLSESSGEFSTSRIEQESYYIPVIARVSSHVVRLEREFHTFRSIVQLSDPECNFIVRPVDLVRLPPEHGDDGPILVSIFESPGSNSLPDLIAFGPAWFSFGALSESSNNATPGEQVSLPVFLDFAIGACDCLEILHYGLKTIHGEIRPDAFHFDRTSGKVKLINMGNGARAFDNALSEGWSALSREVGVKTKLQFIAPEQTGRMPTEPDSRTDIYALGVLFWIFLAGKPAFNGTTPMEVLQNVLGRKLPPVSSKRLDIPDAVSAVVAKMTQKGILDRYHTITAVKKDLEQITKFLGDGDVHALKTFEVAQNNVSSFFTLPSQMFGRDEEYRKIMNVARKVHRRQQIVYAKMAAHVTTSGVGGSSSSVPENRTENFDLGEGSSDSSSFNYVTSRHNSIAGPFGLNHVPTRDSVHSTESSLSTQRGVGALNKIKGSASVEYKSLGDGGDKDSTHVSIHTTPSQHVDSLNSMGRHKTATKIRRGHCEIITITGNPGIGKTDLIQRVQPGIRKLGYIGVARLDRARRIPFEPIAKILTSILRQIFSERDVNTEYHNSLRYFLRPLWPTLHQVLGLPEQLILLDQKETPISPRIAVAQHLLKDGSKSENAKRSSSLHATADFGSSATSTKTMRLMEMYLELLRHLCSQKLICICLDDLQYADDESIDLISNVRKTGIPCLLILAARKGEIESRDLLNLFNAESSNITKIELRSLSEEDVARFVSAAMQLPPDPQQTPLSVVVIEKSQGNPFFIRMMLETCYRKNCIWYSWRNSKWEFDIDRIFTEFVSPEYGDNLGTDFILKRFQEFPQAALSILIWASFLGSPFSFSMIQRLLEGEFWYDSADNVKCTLRPSSKTLAPLSEAEAIAGLQFLVQGYILTPGDTDDEFRFAHDRFARAVSTLRECHNVEKMHFIIAQTMMKYGTAGDEVYHKSHHICQAANLIRDRVKKRQRHRKVLQNSARTALSLGARPTAILYNRHAIKLLQPNCWDENVPDVSYEETLNLHLSTAELLSYQADNEEAIKLLDQVFKYGQTAADKSRGWIIKSRISTLAGDFNGAMDALLASIEELGVHIRQATSYAQCDNAFRELRDYLQPRDLEALILRPVSQDARVVALGTVLAEAISVAYWGDDLTYMYMGVEMMRLHLFTGRFSQVGLACCHLAMVAYSRHKDLTFAARMSDLSLTIFESYAEPSSRGRGFILQAFMVEHLRIPLRTILPFIETSVEYAFSSNDPYLMLTSFGLMAATRLYLGQDMSEIETFCTDTPDEIVDWTRDVRGGALLIAVKQVARALQGKTSWRSPKLILTDDQHNTVEYMDHIQRHSMRADRPHDIYWSFAMIPLYVYGHYDYIIEYGTSMMSSIERLWCMRAAHLTHFILPLAILTKHVDDPKTEGLESRMSLVLHCKEVIDTARRACEVNYAAWSLLIESLMSELEKDFNNAVKAYEAAIDHCEVHGFPLEEAMALELYGDFLVRRGAKRPARAMIREAIAAWTGLGASGKAVQLSEKHEWLLKTATDPRHNDAGTQTVDSLVNINQNVGVETIATQTKLEDDRKKHWLEAPDHQTETGPLDIPSVGLDIIDLSSILEFSQVMSSELQIDKLLTKMIEIILESCSGSDTAVITTEFEDSGFAIAAIGSQDDGQKAFPDGLSFSEMEDKMAQQITHYTLRTRQEVLVHNVLEDERFSIVNEGYSARHPAGRSVITLPITQADNLLGVIHIEGKPNSFTQRNVVVLRLLCNQVGISLGNAFLFRRVRKVSATNAAMVESQKRALAQAREAEQKAKIAEAEANHNVKLKEDAARAKSVFLANVSHDLRTPMNGVIGLSELLKGTKLDKEQDNYVESIRVCADTLLTLINDILDFSKLEAGKMKISTVPLGLKETISEVVRALRYTHRDRGLETIEDLDKVPADLVVMGDPVRLHQIFMNLLSNSYKFTPKGYVKVTALTVREGKGRVRLECSVTDTGIGIPEEHKSRLFRPFSQADNSTARSYGGSGLGLSICKAIIEDVLGGSIWLESTPGVGTTVTFQLVFQRAPKNSSVTVPWMQNFNSADKHDIPRITQIPARDLTSIPRDQIRVCIAEDNPINQKIAVKFVRGLSLDCEAFSDGQQAVEALRQRSQEGRPFHVVLMDVQMPVLDGYDATREIRKQSDPNVNQVLVIAMTASAIEGDREKCIEAGMNNYLAKPVRSSVLSDMLDNYLAPVKPNKLRRRPITRHSSEALRLERSAGTPGSITSSSSGSQAIALTPDDERWNPRLPSSTAASPALSPPALPSPVVSLPSVSSPLAATDVGKQTTLPERLGNGSPAQNTASRQTR